MKINNNLFYYSFAYPAATIVCPKAQRRSQGVRQSWFSNHIMQKSILKKVLFILIFTAVGLALSQIPFTQIVGSKQNFSFFDFMAPASGAFLGGWFGAISVLIVKLINAIFKNQHLDFITIIRLFPLVFAAIYFGTKSKWISIAPLACMALFLVHPEGRGAWVFCLYWLIPIAALFIKNRLIANALGATFTAHAVGSVAFLYAFNLKSAIWMSLIPQVFLERMVMAIGIWVFYLVTNSVLDYLVKKFNFEGLRINQDCRPSWKFFKKFA